MCWPVDDGGKHGLSWWGGEDSRTEPSKTKRMSPASPSKTTAQKMQDQTSAMTSRERKTKFACSKCIWRCLGEEQ
eukprot:3938598-Rhodomonas_salina.2